MELVNMLVFKKKEANESQMLELEFIYKENTLESLVQEMVYADKEKIYLDL